MESSEAGSVLRSAVIGCGAISHEHLAFLASSPLTRLVGVCDTSAVSAAFAGDRFGADGVFTDLTEMLDTVHADVVHILTPPQTHRSLTERCLDSGAHVVCEKPLAPTFADTEAVLKRAARDELYVVESRHLLFNDPVRAVDRLIEGGRLGTVREVDVQLSLDLTGGPFGDLNLAGPGVALPGGAIHDFLPHLVYLFLHFVGHCGDVDKVVGTLANVSGNDRVGYDHLDALVTVGTNRGHLRMVSDLQPDSFRWWVRGTAGTAETDLFHPFLRVEGGANVGKRAPIEQSLSGLKLAKAGIENFRDKVLQHGSYHGIGRMLDAVYRACRDGSAPPVSVDEMLSSARLIDQLVELGTKP